MSAISLKQEDVMEIRCLSRGESDTMNMAAALASVCRVGDCVMLSGEVGAGKTTFARGFILALSPHEAEIVSPTFTLVQSYPVSGGTQLWHFDFYRLKREEELLETGIEDALADGITLIEWPDMARSMLPASALDISIGQGAAPDERQLLFRSAGDGWAGRLDILKGIA